MTEQEQPGQLLSDLTTAAEVLKNLAEDEEAFEELIEAFRKADRQAFRSYLERRKLLNHCHTVCRWICSKECVRICLEFCGPPRADVAGPEEVREFAEIVARITSEERLLKRLIEAIEESDRDDFDELVKELKIERFCHFLCHWVCAIRCRLLCEVLCTEQEVEPRQLIEEVREAGAALRQLAERKDVFSSAIAAAEALNCEILRSVILEANFSDFCFWICEWFCSWRCVRICFDLCQPFADVQINTSVDEMRAFAQTIGRLPGGALERLMGAVARGDAKVFGELVREHRVERYCIQFCHWFCYLRCREYCFCVCPPGGLFPLFTNIGGLDFETDIHSGVGGTGLTIADKRAFFSTLRLNGVLPQTLGGIALQYRFEIMTTDATGNPTGGWNPVLPAQIDKTVIGTWERFPFQHKTYIVNAAPGPNELAATIAADGWITVPQENNAFSPAGAFSSDGNMINLNSAKIAAFPRSNEAGVLAGASSVAPAQDQHFATRMMVRQLGNTGNGSPAGTCHHIAVDNTLYDNVLHAWSNVNDMGDLAVALVDIQELVAHPCNEITNSLTVLFTAAHPNRGAVSISMVGPGGPYTFDLTPNGAATTENFYGTAVIHPPATIAGLKPCAYLITLDVQVLLTTGDSVPPDVFAQRSFCKK